MTVSIANKTTQKHAKLVEPKLSYKIMGVVFNAFKELGYGFQEKYYHRALAQDFAQQKIPFRQEVYLPISYKGKIIGRYYIDFIIANKIALEIKVGNEFYPRDWRQLAGYLKVTKLPLGILILITKKGVRYRRIANTCSRALA